MKSELGQQQTQNNNLSQNGNSNHNNNNNNSNVTKSAIQKKSTAVHDLSHVVAEDCNKLINESHNLTSKYHSYLLTIGSGDADTVQFRDELKLLRRQTYDHIMNSLEKLIPQFDQVSTKDNELSVSIQHIVTYLEYLKLEFIRNRYLIHSFTLESMQKHSEQSNNKNNNASEYNHSKMNYFSNNSFLTNCSDEVTQIERDLKEIESKLNLLSQKYFTHVPDLEEIKLTNKPNEKSLSTSASTTRLFSKCKFICCLCSPKYL